MDAEQIERIIIFIVSKWTRKKNLKNSHRSSLGTVVVGAALYYIPGLTGSKRSVDKRNLTRCQFSKIDFRLNARLYNVVTIIIIIIDITYYYYYC